MKTKTQPIVTREWLQEQLNIRPTYTIGRALCAIYQLQTREEQNGGYTKFNNGIGFSAFDADLGTRCAEYFKQHGKLESWMVKIWSAPAKNGFPRICKYTRQLNEIAVMRAAAKN